MNKDLYHIMRNLNLKFIYDISLIANARIQQPIRVIPEAG